MFSSSLSIVSKESARMYVLNLIRQEITMTQSAARVSVFYTDFFEKRIKLVLWIQTEILADNLSVNILWYSHWSQCNVKPVDVYNHSSKHRHKVLWVKVAFRIQIPPPILCELIDPCKQHASWFWPKPLESWGIWNPLPCPVSWKLGGGSRYTPFSIFFAQFTRLRGNISVKLRATKCDQAPWEPPWRCTPLS
jgi:hypothetical protein